jgi:hypothetical protein
MIRLLLLLHRYLGIAVGALMVMWCLSGIVMMYVSYPALAESTRLQHLDTIDWNGCCDVSGLSPLLAGPAARLRIEMLAGRPVMHLLTESNRPIDLISGSVITAISAAQASAVASGFASDAATAPRLLELLDHDQWTVSGDFNAARPLYHFALNDAARTEVYVSSITGKAVQATTARQRFWNWLGAVPHWLYFTQLRHNPALWSQLVIYAALLGCLLTGIGIFLGVRQVSIAPAGRFSPYRGLNLWHHIGGLCFGLFTLTWVLSGLLSMNPWGLLEGGGARSESLKMRGNAELSLRELNSALHALAQTPVVGIVSLQAAPLDGKVYFVGSTTRGQRQRLDAQAASAPLDSGTLEHLFNASIGSAATISLERLNQEDNFYFTHHAAQASLPVYRAVLPDTGTRYYIDPESGMILAKFDVNARGYRWWHEGLHRMDFTKPLRGRPQWDALMLLLMSGVTLVCVTGAYLGYRRLRGKAYPAAGRNNQRP